MSWDLMPRRGTHSLHYNISGWNWLQEFVLRQGVDFMLAGTNDGDPIPAAVCREIADAIEKNEEMYNEAYGGTPVNEGGYGDKPAKEHAKAWRESGGMRQW